MICRLFDTQQTIIYFARANFWWEIYFMEGNTMYLSSVLIITDDNSTYIIVCVIITDDNSLHFINKFFGLMICRLFYK